MADIAQILALPVPLRTVPQQLTPQQRGETGSADDSAAGSDAKARRFRFRVYEGGDAGASTPQNNQNRPAGPAPLSISDGNAGGSGAADTHSAGQSVRRGDHTGASTAEAGSNNRPVLLSAFLAQSIAQEHLGAGLHNPPFAAATAAYARAGAALSTTPSAGLDLSV